MKKEKNLETMLTISTGLLVFYFIFNLKILIIIALFVSLIGIFFNYLSGKISWLWLKLAEYLGYITSKILLTLIFYCFLTPIAIISRLFNKSNLQLNKKVEGSYWITRNYKYKPEDLKNVW